MTLRIEEQTTLRGGHGLQHPSDGVCPLPPSHRSLPIFKGVEITLTTWWRQTTGEERFEVLLGFFSGVFFSGAGREQDGCTLHLMKHRKEGLSVPFLGSVLDCWGTRHYRDNIANY